MFGTGKRDKLYPKIRVSSQPYFVHRFHFHTSSTNDKERNKEPESRALIVNRAAFEAMPDKNVQTFQEAIEMFNLRGGDRRGHIEFIYAALKYMEEFGVEKDLKTYKKLMAIFPKDKYIPQNFIQVEFMHYPKHQQCAIDILEKMENNGVIPDREMGDIITARFGSAKHTFPARKFQRMMYWMPKFKNLSPWPLPNRLTLDAFELAKLALKRMSSVDLQSSISVFHGSDLEDAIDHTWIVSAQSPKQMKLIVEIPDNSPIYIEGAFRIYLRQHVINYFIMRAEPKSLPPPKRKEDVDDVSNIPLHRYGMAYDEKNPTEIIAAPTVHEQEDGIILGICATGTSSRDSLLSWVRFLQDSNPRLIDMPILFTLKAPVTDVMVVGEVEADDSSALTQFENEGRSDLNSDVKEKEKND